MPSKRLTSKQRDVLYRLAHYADDGYADRFKMGSPPGPTRDRLIADGLIVLAAEGIAMSPTPSTSLSMGMRYLHNHSDFGDWYGITPAGREALR